MKRTLSISLMVFASLFARTQPTTLSEGRYRIVIGVDRAAAFKNVTNPFHRKLLEFGIARVKAAAATFDVKPAGSAMYSFDYGYAPDSVQESGNWHAIPGGFEFVTLASRKGNSGVYEITGPTMVWKELPSLPAFFSGHLERESGSK